jgi:hypothetical protein
MLTARKVALRVNGVRVASARVGRSQKPPQLVITDPREPVQNPKLRYFKPFEFFYHTRGPPENRSTRERVRLKHKKKGSSLNVCFARIKTALEMNNIVQRC